MNSFAVFILTNRRADNVITIKTLRTYGYSGRIILIIDDQDNTLEEYKSINKDVEFYVFNKNEAIELTDSADNLKNPKAVVYARNMCHKIASDLAIDYFLELDDDYTAFDFKSSDDDIYISHKKVKNLDVLFKYFIEFLAVTTAKSISFSQGGDYIGGFGNRFGEKITLFRKCMNSFFCKTDRSFQFYGLINEDVNCYVLNGSRGELYFTSTHISLEQIQTQKNQGGLTDIYLEQGTYIKSFYSVMYHPSSVVVKDMGLINRRLHHSISSNLTYPKIVSEDYKKTV